jgi:hypothetical protein
MIIRRAVLLAVALSAVAGCRQEEEAPGGRTPYEELSIASDTAPGFGREEPAPVVPVQGGATLSGGLTATGNFQAAGGTGETPGMVTVTELEGNRTRLLITAQRMTAGAEFQAAVFRGSCAEQGQRVQLVPQRLQIGAEGIATLQADLAVPTGQLLDGRHSIRLQTPAGEGTADVMTACADLPHAVGAAVQ